MALHAPLSRSLQTPANPNSATLTRVLLADDHPLFRQALRSVVERQTPGVAVEEVDQLSSLLRRLTTPPAPDLILLDLKLPDSEGFAGLATVRNQFPGIPVVIVSASEDRETVTTAIAFGASGYIPKSADTAQLAKALQTVWCGEVWVPETFVPSALAPMAALSISALSPAQFRILVYLRRGMLNKQIAYELGVTEATVKAHLTGLFRKLGVVNRTQALLAAQVMDLR